MQGEQLPFKIIIEYGSGRDGGYWWKVRGSETMHGPFATEAEAVRDCVLDHSRASEAVRDSEVSIFGPQCEVIEGPKIQAAIAAWVAADKAYCAAIRKRGSGPARTKELRRLSADCFIASDVEYNARERLIAILNPDDHRDEECDGD